MTSHDSLLREQAASSCETPGEVFRSQRVEWLDAAKGLGIVFVVAGHALGGMIDSAAGVGMPFIRPAFIAIYVFHMPLFFFLSGLMVHARILRGKAAFFMGLLTTLVYPYFLWSTIQYGAIYAAGSLVNRPVTVFWAPILNLPFSSISQFWYLYVLFLMHLAALLIIPRLGAKGFFGLALFAKLAVAVIAIPVMIRLTFVHGAFYAAGTMIGMAGLERLHGWIDRQKGQAPMILVLGISAVGLATAAIVLQQGGALNGLHSFETSVLAWRLPVLPAAIAGASAVIIAAMLQRGIAAKLLSYLGQRSMAIFVLHILFIAGMRILLNRFTHLPPIAVLMFCMTAGLLLPLIIYEATRRIGNPRLLGMG